MKKGIWSVLFVLVAIAVGFGLTLKPWQKAREEQRRADEMTAKMKREEHEAADLTRRKASLSEPMEQERRAREMGMKGQGEKPIK
ncbi:MAG: hypothetical protein JSS72_13315 [Armatimonadetes bacterium]|nr:hypothetical protein [Armatimonadota bacterium]